MNIAIYGGSFDPPHIAHIQIIESAIEKLDIDKLIVIIAYQNPFKKPCVFDSQKRLAWMKALTHNFPKVEVSDMELLQKKPIPSIESVLNIKKNFNPEKIFFLLGEDNLPTLSKWHRYEELKDLVEFVLIERIGYENDSKNFQKISLPNINKEISSTQIKQKLSIKDPITDLPQSIKEEVILTYKEQD